MILRHNYRLFRGKERGHLSAEEGRDKCGTAVGIVVSEALF